MGIFPPGKEEPRPPGANVPMRSPRGCPNTSCLKRKAEGIPPYEVFAGCAHSPLVSAANKDAEQASTPWCESSPDDFRYGNLTYPDPREREKDQHEKNKR